MRSRRIRLFALIAIAAAVNVPFAITRIVPPNTPKPTPEPPYVPTEWIAPRPPRHEPWPAPTTGIRGHGFGITWYQQRYMEPNRPTFQMTAQEVGWPLPVLRTARPVWSVSFQHPRSIREPRPALLWAGLVGNPILVGIGAYLIVFGPAELFAWWRWRHRRAHNLCLACGYSLQGIPSDRCPECGAERDAISSIQEA